MCPLVPYCSASYPLPHSYQNLGFQISFLHFWALKQAGVLLKDQSIDPERSLKEPRFCFPPGGTTPAPASTTTACCALRNHPSPQLQSTSLLRARSISVLLYMLSCSYTNQGFLEERDHRFPVSSSLLLPMQSMLELSLQSHGQDSLSPKFLPPN